MVTDDLLARSAEVMARARRGHEAEPREDLGRLIDLAGELVEEIRFLQGGLQDFMAVDPNSRQVQGELRRLQQKIREEILPDE